MLASRLFAIVTTALGTLACGAVIADDKQTANASLASTVIEQFDEKPNLKWDIVRPEAGYLSYESHPGELTVTTQAGTIYSHLERDLFPALRNLFLLDRPIASGTDFVATLHVTQFVPFYEDQEVAVVLHQSDNSYFKLTAKCGEDNVTTSLRAVAEFNGGCTPWFDQKQALTGPFWLRLSRERGDYAIFFSDDGDEFRKLRGVGFKPVDPDKPLRVGFYATNGSEGVPPTSKPLEVTIESFQLTTK